MPGLRPPRVHGTGLCNKARPGTIHHRTTHDAGAEMILQATNLVIEMPAWLAHHAAAHALLPDDAQRMRFVIDAARRNVAAGSGGPFAAAVFERDSGRLVALGVNLVTSAGLAVMHAEICALSLAERALGGYDLGAPGRPAHELVTSAEPCAMCLGAIPWSGVRRVVCGATDADVRAIGFDEGDKRDDWRARLEARGVTVVTGVERATAVTVLRDYAARGGTIYNGRGVSG